MYCVFFSSFQIVIRCIGNNFVSLDASALIPCAQILAWRQAMNHGQGFEGGASPAKL